MSSPTSVDLLAPLHRISVERYLRVADAGLFFEGPRVELIDGVIIEMSPAGDRHVRAVALLARVLDRQLDDEAFAPAQCTLLLPDVRSAPEPDIAIRTTSDLLDRSDDAPLLVVEVSDTSLRFDRITKARLYAQVLVAEYWIVDVESEAVEVHRGPNAEGFWGKRTVHRAGETIEPARLPGVRVELAPLFDFIAGRSA